MRIKKKLKKKKILMSIIGLLIDPIPNSPNLQNENHLVDSKENY